jgi:archaellum component FlaC
MASAQNLKVTHAVDNRVKVVVEQVAGVDDRVAGVSNQVEAVDDKVATISSQVGVVNDRVAGVSNQVKAVDDEVATVSNQVEVVDDRVAGVSNQVEAIDDRVATVSNQVEVVDDRVATVDDRVNQIQRSSSPKPYQCSLSNSCISQNANCRRAFTGGSRHQTHPPTITSPVTLKTKPQQTGSFKVLSSRTGERQAPFFGSTENVRPCFTSYPLHPINMLYF